MIVFNTSLVAKNMFIYLFIYLFCIYQLIWVWKHREKVIDKHCTPRSDATECRVWSAPPLLANSLAIFLWEYLNHIAWHN